MTRGCVCVWCGGAVVVGGVSRGCGGSGLGGQGACRGRGRVASDAPARRGKEARGRGGWAKRVARCGQAIMNSRGDSSRAGE